VLRMLKLMLPYHAIHSLDFSFTNKDYAAEFAEANQVGMSG